MGYPYTVGEHDTAHGITVCFVKDQRSGAIVHDGLHIDQAEAMADSLNEEDVICDDDDEAEHACPHCSGTGGEPLDDGCTPCEHCDGEGYQWWR